jgi:SCP-2 sterol transfer family protein
VPHAFLSDEWLDAVEQLRSEAPEPPAALKDLMINVTVSDAPSGNVDAHIHGGQFERGHVDGAPTKVTVPYDVAKSLFIDADPQAAMQAFMAGKIKVEGDMTKLMAMQGAGAPSPEAAAFQKRIQELTE